MSISLKIAGEYLVRSSVMAATATLLMLLIIEWLMPGSVLPFINLIDLLLPALIIFILLGISVPRKLNIWNNVQLIFIVLISGALLAIIAARMELYSIQTALILISGIICAVVWVKYMSNISD